MIMTIIIITYLDKHKPTITSTPEPCPECHRRDWGTPQEILGSPILQVVWHIA
jgi:hypothetical protein